MPFPAWQEEGTAQAPLHYQGATEMSDAQSDIAHCSQGNYLPQALGCTHCYSLGIRSMR